MSIKKYILLFIPFFLLFYMETQNIGGLSISQLWKIPLVGLLVYYLFQYRKKGAPAWSQAYYWLSVKCLFNGGIVKNILANIPVGIPFLFLPLIYNFFRSKETKECVFRWLLTISQYFILTNIPFLFLGMESRGRGIQIGNVMGYSGIFQNQHAMTTLMSVCIIILLYAFKTGRFLTKWVKLYNMLLLLLAVYAMYLGFARTGWLMCLLGVVTLFLPRNLSVKQWIGITMMTVVLGGGFSFMMITNEDFSNRIQGIDSNKKNSKADLSSGRSVYIKNALELYASGNVFELVFGKSQDELMDYEKEKTGIRIYAHNGFVTLLVSDGMIGLVIKLTAMLLLLAFIFKRRNCPTSGAAMAFWLMNLSYQMTQGGHIFHSDLLFALTFCLLDYEYEEQNHENIIYT